MSYVDGNAAAGMLMLAFGTDMTAVLGVCAACGTQHRLAETHVYLRCPGVVLRCPNCDNAEIVLVEIQHRPMVTFTGLRSMAMPG